MRSLRARLTFAYASVIMAALALVTVLGTRLEFEALARATLSQQVAIQMSPEGVIIRVPAAATNQPRPTTTAEAPRGIDALAVALFGIRPEVVVRFRNEAVLLAPDPARLRPAVRIALGTLAAGLLLSLVVAWLIARWITGLAIRPLLTVTAELRRFAGGDFAPRPVRTNDREELGALIAAYNGAAANVAAAFAERRQVEEQMRRFVADAGHELRTPLTVIDGYLQILRKASPNETGVRERAFATLQAQTTRMRALVERLMALARLERSGPARTDAVDVAAVAADAIAAVTSARGGQVELAAGVAPAIAADVADVHEAIANLVDNAVKYGAGSPVTVTVEAQGNEVVVRVRDGGPGIPLAERSRIFERFFRGAERGDVEGSGLGLAIVDRAVARCGGKIELERADPGATSFAIRLPAVRTPVHDPLPLEI